MRNIFRNRFWLDKLIGVGLFLILSLAFFVEILYQINNWKFGKVSHAHFPCYMDDCCDVGVNIAIYHTENSGLMHNK